MKKLLHYIGSFLCLLSIWFLYQKIMPSFSLVMVALPLDLKTWLLFSLLCIAYACALNLLGLAWAKQLRFNGQDAQINQKISIYAQSQIAKYIPGNVFQYIGRSALASQYILDATVVLKSSLYEIISLVLSVLMIIALASQLPFEHILSQVIADYPQANILLFIISLIVIILGLVFIFNIQIKAFLAGYFYPYIVLALLFHLASASIFLALWGGVLKQPLSMETAYMLVFGYLVSWVLGFVTPGAPGGIGVREALFIVLVSNPVIESQVLLLVILSRVVTTLGDLLFFAEGLLIKKLKKNE